MAKKRKPFEFNVGALVDGDITANEFADIYDLDKKSPNELDDFFEGYFWQFERDEPEFVKKMISWMDKKTEGVQDEDVRAKLVKVRDNLADIL